MDHDEEYIRVRKDEYEELKQIKEGIKTFKTYGLPDDIQFVLLTKEDYERNIIKYKEKMEQYEANCYKVVE